jgi:anti-anti-sigma factor
MARGESDVPCRGCGRIVWFARKSAGDVVVLTFLPGLMLGAENGDRLNEVVAALEGSRAAVCNLTHLRLVTSTFLGMLAALQDRVRQAGGAIKLCGVSPDAYKSFQVARLNEVLEIHDTEQAAIDSF